MKWFIIIGWVIGWLVAYPRHKKYLLEESTGYGRWTPMKWTNLEMIKCFATCLWAWWIVLGYYLLVKVGEFIDDWKWLHKRSKI